MILDIKQGIDKRSNQSVNKILEIYGKDFCLQELIVQNIVLNRLYSESINTFRITTYLWKNTIFLTATGRNDWSSTLPVENRSYFYPSVSGSLVFTQFLQDRGLMDDSFLSFAKLRVSWAKVGKDASPYATTYTG